MKDIVMDTERMGFSCTLDTLEQKHMLHLANGRRGRMQYKKSNVNEFNVLSEVHFFIDADSTTVVGEKYSFSVNRIRKMEIIEKNKSKTTVSYVTGGVAYTLSAFVIPVIIIAASGGIGFSLDFK